MINLIITTLLIYLFWSSTILLLLN